MKKMGSGMRRVGISIKGIQRREIKNNSIVSP